MVPAGLEIAGCVDDEIEVPVEGQLLEQVVVEPRSRRDSHAAGAVEPKADTDRGLGRGAHIPCAPPDERGFACERREQKVVVVAIANGDADASSGRAHDEAVPQQSPGELRRLGHRDEDEVRVRPQRLVPKRTQLAPSSSEEGQGWWRCASIAREATCVASPPPTPSSEEEGA